MSTRDSQDDLRHLLAPAFAHDASFVLTPPGFNDLRSSETEAQQRERIMRRYVWHINLREIETETIWNMLARALKKDLTSMDLEDISYVLLNLVNEFKKEGGVF